MYSFISIGFGMHKISHGGIIMFKRAKKECKQGFRLKLIHLVFGGCFKRNVNK